jgi:hypothetical protein
MQRSHPESTQILQPPFHNEQLANYGPPATPKTSNPKHPLQLDSVAPGSGLESGRIQSKSGHQMQAAC